MIPPDTDPHHPVSDCIERLAPEPHKPFIDDERHIDDKRALGGRRQRGEAFTIPDREISVQALSFSDREISARAPQKRNALRATSAFLILVWHPTAWIQARPVGRTDGRACQSDDSIPRKTYNGESKCTTSPGYHLALGKGQRASSGEL
jgi:hypothetical protein